MKNLESWINDVQEKVFSQSFQEVGNEVVAGNELLALFAQNLSENSLKSYNEIISEFIFALQKSDFLLLADILEFHLKPFCKSIGK